MKKFLMTMIVTLAFCGSIFAQHPSTNWPGFDYHAFELQGSFCAALMINGEPVYAETEGWDQMEVAAFVGEELRMCEMYLTDQYIASGDIYPTLDGEPIYYTTPGETLSFKMCNCFDAAVNGFLNELFRKIFGLFN